MQCELVHKAADGPTVKPGRRNYAAVLIAVCLLIAQTAAATSMEQAESLQADADTAGAALLAPTAYMRGTRALERARAAESAATRQRELGQAEESLRAAVAGAIKGRELLGEALTRRSAARDSEAPRLATNDWARAENSLNEAVRALEKDKLDKALARGSEAAERYATAQQAALEARYLGNARSAVLEAEQARADKYSPRSLARAKALVAKAEEVLEKDSGATAEVAAISGDAIYQARIATTIAAQARRVREKDSTVEDLVLESQAHLAGLAETAGTSTDFTMGSQPVAEELRVELERLRALEAELEESRRQVAGLEEELRELDRRLGNASAERRNLMRVVQANLRAREQFEQVESLFTPQEAQVLREGDDVILRMVGLRFPSGSAQLDNGARALLDRLDTAIDIFPRAQVRVEGHTDSSGGAQANQALSQKRASAVADYLVSTTGIQAFRVTAAGYGDTRPVTSNRTAEGRARNRRIDVVIITQPETG